jgi:hypothetical protein
MCRHSKPECRHLGWCSASWGGYGFFTFYDMGKIKIILEKIFGKKIDEIPIDILESHKKIVTIMKLCYNGGLVNDRSVQDNFNELTTLQVIKYMKDFIKKLIESEMKQNNLTESQAIINVVKKNNYFLNVINHNI